MYRHSVRIDRRKCVGCTNCIKTCPTEAIRVQQGKAKMMDERCIDCGRCLSACPHHAMVSVTTPVSALGTFKYNIVIPSTTLYSQFKGLEDLEIYTRDFTQWALTPYMKRPKRLKYSLKL